MALSSLVGALDDRIESAFRHRPISDQELIEELSKTVTLVFWFKVRCWLDDSTSDFLQSHAEPIRLQVMIPTFPYFQLSRFASVVNDLGLSPGSYLDAYNSVSRKWDQHTIAVVRVVETQQRLLYRVRKSLLEGLKDADCVGLQEEIEQVTLRKRPAIEQLQSIPPQKQQRKSPTEPLLFADSTSAVVYDPQSTISSHPHPPMKRFPNDYTVTQIAKSFQLMDSLMSISSLCVERKVLTREAITQKVAFERVFGTRYVKSTVCRHRAIYRKAPQALRDEFEAYAEDDPVGIWGDFVKRVEGKRGISGDEPPMDSL